MHNAQEHERKKELESHEDETRNAIIRQQVTALLGEPDDFRCVQVRRLWQSHYRVNIFAGLDIASAKIVNSYFLQVDGEGSIVCSTPKIGELAAGQRGVRCG